MSHELDSIMLYIHPSLAIAGYILVFLFTILLFSGRSREKRLTGRIGLATWLLTFLGLLSGMVWAQTAWGNYWSWDPKETSTLLLFVAVSISTSAYYERKLRISKWASFVSCLLVIETTLISFILAGLHSFV
jgi:ABC-type transport system involved in cytochrome c biogenesis permease subunit